MDKRRLVLTIIAAAVVILPYIGIYGSYRWYRGQLGGDGHQEQSADSVFGGRTVSADVKEADRDAGFIVIDKKKMTLTLYDCKGRVRHSYGMACGKGIGDKQKVGDMRTPEGVFHVERIQEASGWTHDFNDGKGVIKGAYGPWFIRLATPGHRGIGIHGTHDPESIGTRASEGCIRLRNEDVAELVKSVYPGMAVVITNDPVK